MTAISWQNDLNGLLVRFFALGIGSDVTAKNQIGLWGVYCLLRSLAES
jgi:hypothetical protein